MGGGFFRESLRVRDFLRYSGYLSLSSWVPLPLPYHSPEPSSESQPTQTPSTLAFPFVCPQVKAKPRAAKATVEDNPPPPASPAAIRDPLFFAPKSAFFLILLVSHKRRRILTQYPFRRYKNLQAAIFAAGTIFLFSIPLTKFV